MTKYVCKKATNSNGEVLLGIYQIFEEEKKMRLVQCGLKMDYQDFRENMSDNECFSYIQSFTTISGNKFIVAYDSEIDEVYIIKYSK